jgi:hypothetical protein
VKASSLTMAVAGRLAVDGTMHAAFAQGVGSGSPPESGSGSGSAPVAASTSPSSSSGLGGSASGRDGVGGGAAPSGGVCALYGCSGPPKRSDPTPPTGTVAPNGTGARREDVSNPQGGTPTSGGEANQFAEQSPNSKTAGVWRRTRWSCRPRHRPQGRAALRGPGRGHRPRRGWRGFDAVPGAPKPPGPGSRWPADRAPGGHSLRRTWQAKATSTSKPASTDAERWGSSSASLGYRNHRDHLA